MTLHVYLIPERVHEDFILFVGNYLNPSNAGTTFVQSSMMQNLLTPAILVFIGKLSMSTMSTVR